MASRTCPRCGTPVVPSDTSCPNCRIILKKKSALTPYIIIAGLIIVIIIVLAVVMMSPAPGPQTTIAPMITASPTSSDESIPVQPTCTIGITGSQVSSSSIRLELVQSTCSPGEVTELQVSVNGAQVGTLGISPGTSRMFSSPSEITYVVVTAKYSDGAESVVYQSTL